MLQVVVMLLMAMVIPACSDDKKDEPADPATHDQELIGSWEHVWEVFNGNEDLTVYTFRKDGSFECYDQWLEDDRLWSEKSGGDWRTDDYGHLFLEFTYIPDDWDDDEEYTERLNYRVIDSETIMIDGDRYTRR